MLKLLVVIFFLSFKNNSVNSESNIPIVLTTWMFTNATQAAWSVLKQGGHSLDAIENGVGFCEINQCEGTVGHGGSPDEHGETTLDALIMDGKTMKFGAVGALRAVKNAISVARCVLQQTKHSFLAGELASQFALDTGFTAESLSTKESEKMWYKWHNVSNCQPNYWKSVAPDPSFLCGPYCRICKRDNENKMPTIKVNTNVKFIDETGIYNRGIAMVCVDKYGNVAAGSSANGAKFKIPGAVGEASIPGASAYADNTVGGAVATGDGEILLNFMPSFLAVEQMRQGRPPLEAALTALQRITSKYPKFLGAVIALSKTGLYGAACQGIPTFPFLVQDSKHDVFVTIKCFM